MRSTAGILICFILTVDSFSQIVQWRGPDRAGLFPETGLLSEWPEQDPEFILKTKGVGDAYSSLQVGNEKLPNRRSEVLIFYNIKF